MTRKKMPGQLCAAVRASSMVPGRPARGQNEGAKAAYRMPRAGKKSPDHSLRVEETYERLSGARGRDQKKSASADIVLSRPRKKSSDHNSSASSALPTVSDATPIPGHEAAAHAIEAVPGIGTLIPDIRFWHRQRCYAMEQRKRIDLALGSYLRVALGWSLALPEEERKAISAAAEALDENDDLFGPTIGASRGARAPFEKIENDATKALTVLAQQLPVWLAFGVPIRGFGAASLAVIIGECGDLSNYSTVAKVWKRMGLAVLDGVRQGGLPKGASKEDWIVHGYSAVRRSRMWNIGDAIIKGNRDGEYRKLYLARKDMELARDPEMSPMKAHRRAQRYMEKRLLKHLWQAWRKARDPVAEKPKETVSSAEPPASLVVPPRMRMPAAKIRKRRATELV
jgi:hypothetical protein